MQWDDHPPRAAGSSLYSVSAWLRLVGGVGVVVLLLYNAIGIAQLQAQLEARIEASDRLHVQEVALLASRLATLEERQGVRSPPVAAATATTAGPSTAPPPFFSSFTSRTSGTAPVARSHAATQPPPPPPSSSSSSSPPPPPRDVQAVQRNQEGALLQVGMSLLTLAVVLGICFCVALIAYVVNLRQPEPGRQQPSPPEKEASGKSDGARLLANAAPSESAAYNA